MTKLLAVPAAFLLLSVVAVAQIDALQRDMAAANQRYLEARRVTVTQHYLFSFDSANAVPFDSGYCSIEKYDGMQHFSFGGIESFSDGTWQIRVSNPSKFMVISRNSRRDSSGLGTFLNEGLAGFKSIAGEDIGDDLRQWRLTGGVYGVTALVITLDTREHRIQSIIAELLPDHPFLTGMNIRRPGNEHSVVVRIGYAYATEPSGPLPQLSDYIIVGKDRIVPADRFKEYQIKIIE